MMINSDGTSLERLQNHSNICNANSSKTFYITLTNLNSGLNHFLNTFLKFFS
jgi:hypothetical protein